MWDGIIAMQTHALTAQAPIANWNTMYRAIMQRMKAMKVKGADLYWVDPANAPPAEPPPPTPEQTLANAEVEKAKIKAESDRAKMASDERIEQIKLQIKLVELRQQEMALGIKDRDSLVNAAVAADEQDRADRQETSQNIKDIAGFVQGMNPMGDFNG
jgi:type IV secretory pathway VirB10-like protein